MLKKNKKAYTLVEMMVVMGIMAILAILGATAMIGANDDNIAEEAAQNILSSIREAQTKAISVTPNKGGFTGKVWALELNLDTANTYYNLDSYYLDALNSNILTNYPNNTPQKLRAGIAVKVTRKAASGVTTATYNSGKSFVAFATPFARSYITLTSDYLPGRESGFCKWTKSIRPEEDWGIDDKNVCSTVINSSSTDYVVIEISFKNKTFRNIRVNSNGEAYVQ